MRGFIVILMVFLVSCYSSGESTVSSVKLEIELIEYLFLLAEVDGEDSTAWRCFVSKTTHIEQGTNRMIQWERNRDLNFQMECFEAIIGDLEAKKINEWVDKIPKGRIFYDFPKKPTSIYCGPSFYLKTSQNSQEQALVVGVPTEMPEEVTHIIRNLDRIAKSRSLVNNSGSECQINENELIERIMVIDSIMNRLPMIMTIPFQIPSP